MRKVKKILFFADAQLGDLLLLTPALKALKKEIPDSTITLLLLHRRYYNNNIIPHTGITETKFEGTAQVFQNNTDVNSVYELDRQSIRSLKGIKRLRAELRAIGFLRRMKFDAMVCTFPQSRFLLWAFLSGCPVRIGQKDQPMSYLLTDKVDTSARKNGVLNYYCELLKPLGVHSNDKQTVFNVTDAQRSAAKSLLSSAGIDINKKILFIHPGASAKYKIWPPKYFAEVIDTLLDENLVQVVISSNEFDKDAAEDIQKYSKHMLTFFSSNDISTLASVISLCSLSLVNNSGPRHISAAVGTRSLSMFQKFDNGEWDIYDKSIHPVIEMPGDCPVCNNNKCEALIIEGEKFGSECMWQIKPREVTAKIKDILKKNN